MLPYNNKNIVSIFDLSYTEICDKLSINPITAKSKYFVLTETPHGTTAKKYGYWLNAKYTDKPVAKLQTTVMPRLPCATVFWGGFTFRRQAICDRPSIALRNDTYRIAIR